MDIGQEHIPHLMLGSSFILFIITLLIYTRARALKKRVWSISEDISKKTVSSLIDEFSEEKTLLTEKVINGRSVLSKLQEAYSKSEVLVNQIKSGLSIPSFKVDDDESLKSSIREIRERQYEIIKANRATTSLSEWSWFGSKKDGKKLINTYNSLMISAFNAEFDMAREKMRHGSYDVAVKKLRSSVSALEKLAETVQVLISQEYLAAKEEELQIWHADLVRKQEEKETRKKQKEILREQNKVLGRISDDEEDGNDDEEIESQLTACSAELEKARSLAKEIAGDELARLELKIAQIEEEKQELEEKFERSISQAQITRAGYLYVISNIGSFGEGVCKIGMTRRLEPMDRVVELGDASVPYRFDVHTLAFVEDAPGLEKALHRVFDSKRVNQENNRKEFFFVSPQEAKAAMENIGIKSPWYYECDAREFRESELLRESMQRGRRGRKSAISELPESI
jgi:hypothetical protein